VVYWQVVHPYYTQNEKKIEKGLSNLQDVAKTHAASALRIVLLRGQQFLVYAIVKVMHLFDILLICAQDNIGTRTISEDEHGK
jgi:hypothetical protein